MDQDSLHSTYKLIFQSSRAQKSIFFRLDKIFDFFSRLQPLRQQIMGNVPILHAHTVNKRLLCGILGGDKLPFDSTEKTSLVMISRPITDSVGIDNRISFTLAVISYAEVQYLYTLRKKTSHYFFTAIKTCHAHSRPFQAKHAQKCQEKNFPWERKQENNFPREGKWDNNSLGKVFFR